MNRCSTWNGSDLDALVESGQIVVNKPFHGIRAVESRFSAGTVRRAGGGSLSVGSEVSKSPVACLGRIGLR